MIDFKYSGSIETYTIVNEGRYIIECWGASGGGADRSTCGLGAYSRSTYYLHAGDVLKILVAGKGAWDGSRGGGGGGSFVELNSTTLLCSAGGGGGSMFSRAPNNYSHGQAGQHGGNYNLTGILTGVNSAGRSDLCSGTGGASYSNNSGNNGGTAPQYNDTILIGAKAFKNGGASGYGIDGHNSGGYYISELDAQRGGFGGGGCGAVYRVIGVASAVGGNIYYYNGAGGGGGYSGGDSTRDGYGNTGGGGGSYYVGTTGIEFAKAGYEVMPTIADKNSSMIGNFGDGFVRVSVAATFIFSDENNFYIPTKDFFDVNTKSFKKLTSNELETEVLNKTLMPISIAGLNAPITINNEETIRPSEIMDLTKYKICIIYGNTIDKLNIKYTPSYTALSKTNIKIKDKYKPISDELEPTFLDITSNDKSELTYFLDYGESKSYKKCTELNKEVINKDFYANFMLNDQNALLRSVILYGKNNDKYNKIKNYNIEVYEDCNRNKLVNFKNSYDEIIVNRIAKESFDYTIDTLDTF